MVAEPIADSEDKPAEEGADAEGAEEGDETSAGDEVSTGHNEAAGEDEADEGDENPAEVENDATGEGDAPEEASGADASTNGGSGEEEDGNGDGENEGEEEDAVADADANQDDEPNDEYPVQPFEGDEDEEFFDEGDEGDDGSDLSDYDEQSDEEVPNKNDDAWEVTVMSKRTKWDEKWRWWVNVRNEMSKINLFFSFPQERSRLDLAQALEEKEHLLAINKERHRKILLFWERDKQNKRTQAAEEKMVNGQNVHNADQIQAQYIKTLDQLNILWDKLDQKREDAEEKINVLTAKLDRQDEKATELSESFKAFKREIAREARHSRTGKPVKLKRILAFEGAEEVCLFFVRSYAL